ncbi:MAG: hypothetical protein Q7S22_04700 [Candidatus Micrarchaeota archaeon]|nr:hypothetical protein [Candidatus Micrarchaeota archaeon]
MNIHVKLTGEAANAVEDLIKNGYAANKTEAIRHAVLECNHTSKGQDIDEEEEFYRKASAHANKDLDNEGDEKMSQWYMNRSEHESKKK